MGVRGFQRSCLIIVFVASFILLPNVRAQDSSTPRTAFQLAFQAIQAGNNQEALVQIQRAILEKPGNLDYQYLLGGIYFRMQKTDEAEVIFQALIHENEGRYRGVYFDLANIYLRRGEEAAAIGALKKARPADPGRADYETGIVYMRLKDYPKAIDCFRQVKSDGGDMVPRATAQEAIALFYQKKYDESRTALEDALKMRLPPETAAELRRLLEVVRAVAKSEKRWHVTGATGLQYDGNIFQNAFNPSSGTSGEGDGAFVANVTGRYDLYKSDPWKIGAAYNHYQVTYFQHAESGPIGASPSIYAEWNNAPFFANIQYMYSHFWSGGDSRVDVQSLFPGFTILEGEHWRTDFRAGFESRAFLDTTPDDRIYSVGVTEMYLMQGGNAHIRAGYFMSYDDVTESDRGTYISNTGMLGFQYPLWWNQWFLDISGLYVWRNYDFDPLISLTTKRRDEEKDFNVLIRGPITSNLGLNFLLQQIWNDSDIKSLGGNQAFNPYNYKRTVFTCLLTFDY